MLLLSQKEIKVGGGAQLSAAAQAFERQGRQSNDKGCGYCRKSLMLQREKMTGPVELMSYIMQNMSTKWLLW